MRKLQIQTQYPESKKNAVTLMRESEKTSWRKNLLSLQRAEELWGTCGCDIYTIFFIFTPHSTFNTDYLEIGRNLEAGENAHKTRFFSATDSLENTWYSESLLVLCCSGLDKDRFEMTSSSESQDP